VIDKGHVKIHGTGILSKEKDLTIDPLDLLVINHQV